MAVPPHLLDGARRGRRRDGGRSEMDILRAVMQYMAARRIRVERVNTGAMRQSDPRRRKGYRVVRFERKGTPDLRGLIRPWPGSGLRWAIPVYVEIKRPGQRLTVHQDFRLRELRADGALAFWATSVADVARELDAAGVPNLGPWVPR